MNVGLRMMARGLVPAGIALCVWIAWRNGGGAEAKSALPSLSEELHVSASEKAAATTTQSPAGAGTPKVAGADAYQVTTRLIDLLGDAEKMHASTPNLHAGLAVMNGYWRKMQAPWTPLSGDAAKLVTSIALRTSATETQWSAPMTGGRKWEPDARVWNMNEGSYDQREAIVAPTPASYTFHVAIPPNAKLTFAMGTVNDVGAPVTFSVSATDPKGVSRDLFAKNILKDGQKNWTDGIVDLASFAGETIDLTLSTQVTSMTPAPPSMSAALWGNPTILAKQPTDVPYNVLWIVVDALRPDVLASFHDDQEDAAKLHATYPPNEALLPKVSGLTPAIDELAAHGVVFAHAYSNGSWTRPGTLSMLSGERSSELGVETLPWVLPETSVDKFYASSPPLLPLLLRAHGVTTRAFVNNYFMVGYAPVGVDMGFERVDDHRYRSRDTLEITTHAIDWLKQNKDDRFFVFCNYNSPHEPWDPPKRFQERVPAAPEGPKDNVSRLYMAEAAKDDEAIGLLMKTLDEEHLRDHTIVIVTADHGETLSASHGGVGLDKMPVRYHHAVSNYEETTRIPILISLPHALREGARVNARVRNIDIAPTVLALLGLEASPKMSGSSLVPLARGDREVDERVVLSEGRGTRGLLAGKYRLLVREGAAQTTTYNDHSVTVAEELYDLDEDPGERHNVARERPDALAEMKARLLAAMKNVPTAGTRASLATDDGDARVHLRFAGGGAAHRVSGTITALSSDANAKALGPIVTPVGIGTEAIRVDGPNVEVAFTTATDGIVGLELRAPSKGSTLKWDLYLDDKPWPAARVFGGAFGLAAPSARNGITTEDAQHAVYSRTLAEIDPQRDLGMFVTRDQTGDAATSAPVSRTSTREGSKEMSRILREWGYAHGSGSH